MRPWLLLTDKQKQSAHRGRGEMIDLSKYSLTEGTQGKLPAGIGNGKEGTRNLYTWQAYILIAQYIST